jgi:hypothetical protein
MIKYRHTTYNIELFLRDCHNNNITTTRLEGIRRLEDCNVLSENRIDISLLIDWPLHSPRGSMPYGSTMEVEDESQTEDTRTMHGSHPRTTTHITVY